LQFRRQLMCFHSGIVEVNAVRVLRFPTDEFKGFGHYARTFALTISRRPESQMAIVGPARIGFRAPLI